MTFTWADIRRWNEGYLTDTLDDMRLLRQRALDAQEDVETSQRNFTSKGRTADGVRSRQDTLITYMSGIVQESSEIMMALANATDGVWEVRTRITDCEQYADSRGLTLDSQTGAVSDTIDDLIPRDSNGNPMYRAADSVKISVRRSAADTLINMVAQTLTRAVETNDSHLIALDLTGHSAKAAVAIGNLDTADHIGALVPGLGTRLNSSAEYYVSQTGMFRRRMANEPSIDGHLERVATVAWMDYEAPGPGNAHSVVGTGLAEAGSRRLAAFTEGLHNVQMMRGKDPHLTHLAHF